MYSRISRLKTFLSFKKQALIKIGLILCLSIPIFYANHFFLFHPLVLKKRVQKFKNEKPKTLQTVKGSILGDELDIHVIKMKYRGRVYLDFLSRQEDGTFHFIDSLTLKGKHDGFFEYWNEPLSLALLDDNGDGLLEVIAPTFDKFLKPQLNVIFYNKEKKKFQIKSFLKSKPKTQ